MTDATAKTATPDWNIPPHARVDETSRFGRMMARKYKATAAWEARISEPREKELLELLQNTSQQMGISPSPRLIIYASPKPNAVSNGHVMIATSLIDGTPPDQLKAVLAHELVHHKNRAHDTMLKGAKIAGIIAASAVLYKKLLPSIPTLFLKVAAVISGLAAEAAGWLFYSRWVTRQHEYRSDVEGAKIAGTGAMISQLETLGRRQKQPHEGELSRAEKLQKSIPLLRTHPTPKQRIARLIEEAPQSFRDRQQTEYIPNAVITAR